LKYCVRLGLYAGGTSIEEINFYESVVTLNITMNGTFEILSVSVAPKAQGESTAAQEYKVTASLCDAEGVAYDQEDDEKFNQGAAIVVCINLDEAGLADQVQITSVDEFTWTRDGTSSQTAVGTPGGTGFGSDGLATNGLTMMAMNAAKSKATITSILFAKFYESVGTVLANGSVTMAFGAGASDAAGGAGAGNGVWNVADSGHVSEACSTLCSAPGMRRAPVPETDDIDFRIREYINHYGEEGRGSALFGDDINCWDISQRTTLTGFKEGASNYPLYCWDTSSITSMARLFYNNPTFNQDISMWDVSQVTDFGSMFVWARAFDQNMCNWSASIHAEGTNSGSMFRHTLCSGGVEATLTSTACQTDCDPGRRLGGSSSNNNNNIINNINRSSKRTLQDVGTAESAFDVSVDLNKADDGPVALQQTAGAGAGVGTSITVVATSVGLVSALLLA